MKPVTLTMTAFGPYASRQVIDFSQLGNRKMFVISGKTGSGKTTIFDAISFAVYGKPSGDQRSAADMRSQFADAKQITEVELLFELKGRKYFIRRTPQQEKPKTRGHGTTTAGATAELYECKDDGSRVLLAANVRDTDEKMNELIGLEASQFRQILMIPQGEFQKLLIASSQDKEKILQKLFQTSFYKRVEDVLKEKSDKLKQEAGKAADQQTTLLKSLPAYSEEMRILLEEEELQKNAVLEQLAADVSAMERVHEERQAAVKQLKSKRDHLLGERERAIALNAQFDRLAGALEAKEKQEEQKDRIVMLTSHIHMGERAEKLLSYEMHGEKAEKAAAAAQERKKDAEEKKTKALAEFKQADTRLKEEEQRQPEREEKAKQLQTLQSLKEAVFSYKEAAEREQKASACLEKTKQESFLLAEKEQQLAAKEQKAEEWFQALQSSKERVLEAEQLILTCSSLLEQYEELEEAQKQLAASKQKKQEAQKKAEETAGKAAVSLEELRHLRMEMKKSQAAFLAQQLTEGEPCAVCGSVHHPLPAKAGAFQVSEEALERAELLVSKADRANREAEQALAAARFSAEAILENIKKITAKLPASFQKEEVEKKLDQAVKARSQAEQDQRKKEEIQAQLQAVKQEKNQLLKQMEQNREAEMNDHGAYVKAKTELLRLKQLIPEKMRDLPFFINEYKRAEEEVNQTQKKLDDAKEAYQHWKAALQTAESVLKEREQTAVEANELLKEAESMFLARREEAGFESGHLYQEAKQFVPALEQMKTTVRAYEEQVRELSLQIAELQTAVAGRSRINIEQLEKTITALNDELEEWTGKAGAVLAQIKESIRVREAVEQIAGQMSQVEEAYRLAGHLYHIAHGKNDLKITFERYVLASFLEDIITAANARLAGMTNGRFLLERQTERAKGNAQSGLDLLVFDQYTGSSRHVKTLSGGESFKAALALALGLAEVVQNYAGGVSLETMFVDEGFGTLDPESLDQAIETLMDIQADGRLVGIISHVPELKERIDARLEVNQSDSGSKASFVFTGEA